MDIYNVDMGYNSTKAFSGYTHLLRYRSVLGVIAGMNPGLRLFVPYGCVPLLRL